MKTTRYIFVTGGIMSSLGKGIAAASIGALLQSRGWSVKIKKMDPYINFDPGTMSPYRHGEVFVMSDGGETDLDFGHYGYTALAGIGYNVFYFGSGIVCSARRIYGVPLLGGDETV